MSSMPHKHGPEHSEQLFLYAVQALPAGEASAFEAHVSVCPQCRREMETLRPTIEAFVSWPTDVVRPAASLWHRVSQRIALEAGGRPVEAPARRWVEPDWKVVAPGISCKLLATDSERHRISMLVRLDPGTDYPPHTHAGVEELHLLHGELWIDDRKLCPGEYNRAEPGTADARVWSETGCPGVLITSTQDELR